MARNNVSSTSSSSEDHHNHHEIIIRRNDNNGSFLDKKRRGKEFIHDDNDDNFDDQELASLTWLTKLKSLTALPNSITPTFGDGYDAAGDDDDEVGDNNNNNNNNEGDHENGNDHNEDGDDDPMNWSGRNGKRGNFHNRNGMKLNNGLKGNNSSSNNNNSKYRTGNHENNCSNSIQKSKEETVEERYKKFVDNIMKCRKTYDLSEKKYQNDTETKPLFNYSEIIGICLYENGRSTLKEICRSIEKKFAYFRARRNYNNSIRHNLSLHAFFRKIERHKDITSKERKSGKGGYWELGVDLRKSSRGKRIRNKQQQQQNSLLNSGGINTSIRERKQHKSNGVVPSMILMNKNQTPTTNSSSSNNSNTIMNGIQTCNRVTKGNYSFNLTNSIEYSPTTSSSPSCASSINEFQNNVYVNSIQIPELRETHSVIINEFKITETEIEEQHNYDNDEEKNEQHRRGKQNDTDRENESIVAARVLGGGGGGFSSRANNPPALFCCLTTENLSAIAVGTVLTNGHSNHHHHHPLLKVHENILENGNNNSNNNNNNDDDDNMTAVSAITTGTTTMMTATIRDSFGQEENSLSHCDNNHRGDLHHQDQSEAERSKEEHRRLYDDANNEIAATVEYLAEINCGMSSIENAVFSDDGGITMVNPDTMDILNEEIYQIPISNEFIGNNNTTANVTAAAATTTTTMTRSAIMLANEKVMIGSDDINAATGNKLNIFNGLISSENVVISVLNNYLCDGPNVIVEPIPYCNHHHHHQHNHDHHHNVPIVDDCFKTYLDDIDDEFQFLKNSDTGTREDSLDALYDIAVNEF